MICPGNDSTTESASPNSRRRTSVYRYYDSKNLLIYVGVTACGLARNRQHNADKEWWPRVNRQMVEHFETRDEALSRERELIQRHSPPFNRQHNKRHRQARIAYRAVVENDLPSFAAGCALRGKTKHEVSFRFADQALVMGNLEATYIAIDPSTRVALGDVHKPLMTVGGVAIGRAFGVTHDGRGLMVRRNPNLSCALPVAVLASARLDESGVFRVRSMKAVPHD